MNKNLTQSGILEQQPLEQNKYTLRVVKGRIRQYLRDTEVWDPDRGIVGRGTKSGLRTGDGRLLFCDDTGTFRDVENGLTSSTH